MKGCVWGIGCFPDIYSIVNAGCNKSIIIGFYENKGSVKEQNSHHIYLFK